MGVLKQTTIEYPPLDSLFDAEAIKGMGTRRVLAPANGWIPRVHGTLYDEHQDWALGCFLRYDRFLLFSDTGLGKTKSALDAIDYHFTHRGAKHALVLTGNPTATYEWAEQGEHYIQTAVKDVQGTPAQRRAQLLHFPEAPIIATDYHTLQTAFAVKAIVRKKGKFVADLEALYQFGRLFDIVILDEIHRLKTIKALRSQMVAALVTDIPVRYGLTGTPFDRHPEDAWHQYYLIDGGETFKTQHEFIQYFFDEKRSYWSVWQTELKLRREMKDEFKRRVRHRGIRITKKECKNLPEVIPQPVRLKPTNEMIPQMHAAEDRVKKARENQEQRSEFAFLRQVCSGLIRVKAEDIDATVRMKESPKITWVLAKLEELPKEEQVVIFYEFRASGAWLNEELLANKYTVSWLHGNMQNKEQEVLAAWRRKKTRILLTQTEKAAESLNLQQSAYLIQYESPTTYRAEKQSTSRVGGRIGGRHSIIYQLSIRGSIENRVLELLREGKNLSTALLEKGDDESRIPSRPSPHQNASANRVRLLNR